MPFLRRWDEMETVVAGPTVTKQAASGDGASLVRLEIKAGSSAARHIHPFEQFVHVVSGAGRLETEEGNQRFSSGSLFHFPAGTWHAAEFDEDTVLVETNLVARQN